MSSGTRRIAVAAVAAALFAGGCGDDDAGEPIPAESAESLSAELDEFQEALDAGDCEGVDARIQELRSQVSRLRRDDVGPDVRDALDEGIARLGPLAAEACEPEEEVETTPTVPPPPPPTETTPPPTETTPPPDPELEPEEPEEPEEPKEPDEGDGGGQFEPNDGGAGPDGNGAPGQLKRGDN